MQKQRDNQEEDKMLILGDCLVKLKEVKGNSIDLVYLDPPFFSQKMQSLKTRNNEKKYSFNDKWESIDSYKNYIKERLFECKRVLKKTGSIFLHCDRAASHYLRLSLDEVFGFDKFQSEIIWAYKRWSNAKKGLLNCHQVIYFYSKSDSFKFNKIFEAYSPTTNIDQIFQKRTRDINGKTKYKIKANGEFDLIEEKNGVLLSDVWEIPYLNPKANERVGYPTQKPVLLLERIINLVTDESDIVLDPFCGSGTTLVAAKLLNRKYVGIDMSSDALELSKDRLARPFKSDSNVFKLGKSSYMNQTVEVNNILEIIGATPVQRNKGIDGFLKINGATRPIPVKVQNKSETLDDAKNCLLQASKKNKFQLKVLVAFNSKGNAIKYIDNNIVLVDDIVKFSKSKELVIKKMINTKVDGF